MTSENTLRFDTTLRGLTRCPHCGVAKPFLAQIWKPQHNSLDYEGSTTNLIQNWAVYRCSSCLNFLLAAGYRLSVNDVELGQKRNLVERIFPDVDRIDENLPTSAHKYLQQALESLHAPDAAAVIAASAVDSMLKARGYEKGSLYERINKAVEDHVLTQDMGHWAHAVRLEANSVRHTDEDAHKTPDEARRIVEFAKALGDFLFVFTARVQKGLAG